MPVLIIGTNHKKMLEKKTIVNDDIASAVNNKHIKSNKHEDINQR